MSKKTNKSQKKPIQRILIFLSCLAFFGGTGFGIARMFTSNSYQQSEEVSNSETQSADEKLKAIANGYQKVLEREPENRVALQGLLDVRLQMNDLEGAIEPMEKLVQLYPEQQNLKIALAQIKQQLETESKSDISEESK